MKQQQCITCTLLAATVLTAGSAMGGTAPAVTGKGPVEPAAAEKDWCKDLWSLATLYKNKDNPIIQELVLTGRYHGQYAYLDSDDGDADGWDHRRFRLGVKMIVLHDFELKFEEFGDLNNDDFYTGFTEAYLAYKPNDALNIILGKQKPKFSLDWSTSSREILTIERNIMINNFGPEYEPGLSIGGKSGNWSYYAGIFNNDVGESGSNKSFERGEAAEFGDLNGSWTFVANAGYDLKDYIGTERAVLRFDYVHSNHDVVKDEYFRKFDNGYAASFNVKQGQMGLIAEALYGTGDLGDAWGFYILPSYDITKKLQVVARYTHGSSGDDILQAQRRYERGNDDIIQFRPVVDGGNGKSYNAGYLGLNYYICGHKLKLMTGFEYASMDGGRDGGDFDGWTWTSGLRFYF